MESNSSEVSLKHSINKLCIIVLFSIGLLNNFGFSMIFTGAHSIINQIHEKNSIGIIIISLALSKFLILLINLIFCLGLATKSRILVCCSLLSISYGLIAYSLYTSNFFLAIFSFSIIGMTSSVGEVINLGLLKEFLPEYLYGFTSGTGSARIITALI